MCAVFLFFFKKTKRHVFFSKRKGFFLKIDQRYQNAVEEMFGDLNVPGNGVGFDLLNPGPLNMNFGKTKSFNPVDPSSFNLGEGFDFTLDAFADGEPIKGSYMQAQFSDNSQFNILSARMLVYMCSGFATRNESSVILLNLGWINHFSNIHHERGKKTIINILNALKSQLQDSGIANASANSSASNSRLRQLLNHRSNDFSDSELISSHKKITETIFSGKNSEKMDESLIDLWIRFIKYIGSESALLEIMNGPEHSDEAKYMTGHEPFSRNPQKLDEALSALKKNTPIHIDSVFKHSSKFPTSHNGELVDLIGSDYKTNNPFDIEDAARLFGVDKIALSGIKSWDELVKKETLVQNTSDGVFKHLLHQFVASRQIPMGYAYDPNSPVSLHLLFKPCHDSMFKFLGVVEDIMENRETRSMGGHQMFGTPPMTIVTERVVEISNVWGVPLQVGQPLYLVKTRRLLSGDVDEVKNGSWMRHGKKSYARFGGHYYSNNYASSTTRSNANETWAIQNRTKTGFPPSVSEQESKESQKRSNFKFDFGSVDGSGQDDYADVTTPINKIQRGSINRTNWGNYSLKEKMNVAWNAYGSWVSLPICGLSMENMRRYYGYPDYFGGWNDPQIIKIGVVRSLDTTLSQNADAARHVVSGMGSDSSNPLTREELLSKTGMLDHFLINLSSKPQQKMAI